MVVEINCSREVPTSTRSVVLVVRWGGSCLGDVGYVGINEGDVGSRECGKSLHIDRIWRD